MDQSIGETWRPIPGWEGLYEVSDHGRVKSLSRVVMHSQGGPKRIRERILSQDLSTDYPVVTLFRNGSRRRCLVHLLVLAAFVGPCPEGLECRHRDGNKTNARLDNLHWGTHSDNEQDKKLHGTDNRGDKHPLAKLSDDEVCAIRSEYRRWSYHRTNMREICAKYGITQPTLSRIVSRKGWTHLD